MPPKPSQPIASPPPNPLPPTPGPAPPDATAAPLPLAHQPRQPAQRFRIEAQRLAYLARRGLAAIADDVRCHRGAQLAVPLVDILDGLLALLFRSQIEIDVRPFAAVLAQEPLEEQFHTHRVDGRNLQRIADRRVRRAAPSLHQDVVLDR